MTEKKVYVSDDGTEFETQEECEKYEACITEFPPCIIALDSAGNKVECPDDWTKVDFLIIKDGAEEDLEILYEYYACFDREMNPGCWYYNEDNDEWENFDDLYTRVSGMKEIFDRCSDA